MNEDSSLDRAICQFSDTSLKTKPLTLSLADTDMLLVFEQVKPSLQ